MNGANRSKGFALVVVLLVSMVALMAAVSGASMAALSSREVASSEQRSTAALFAAESALNTVLARSRTPIYAYDQNVHDSVSDWLLATGLDSYSLPSGAKVTLEVMAENAGVATLKATGTARDGSVRVIYQDFIIDSTQVKPEMMADAALVTKDALKTNSNNSRLVGRGIEPAEWRFEDRTLLDARPGEYVEMGGKVYRVEDRGSEGNVHLVDINDPIEVRLIMPHNTKVTLLPFALTETVTHQNGENTTLKVSYSEIYEPGTTIAVGDYRGTVVARRSGEIDVEWDFDSIPSGELEEGLPVRRLVPSAVAEGGCPSGKKIDDKLPQGCVEEALGELWANTFAGLTRTDIQQLAVARNAYYKGGSWPTNIDGLTWIDGAKTQGRNNSLCGTGVVILNTGSSVHDDGTSKINLTTSHCEFRGILYVIGQLKLVGNLDNLSGTIIVEGPGRTEVQGTGAKSTYDPLAIRDALESMPPVVIDNGLYAAVPKTLRFGR